MHRKLIAFVSIVFTFLFVVTSFESADALTRARLRRQVGKLRTEVSQLAAQVDFLTRSASDGARPVQGGGVIYPGTSWNMCADPCASDSDGDGLGDCEDWCPCDPNTADDDSDGYPDCADPCPGDTANDCMNPCNWDSDGDGIGDCEDKCPYDPAPEVDTDADGIVDCQDICPQDPSNQCWDWCNLDQDGDGTADCKDPCPWSAGEGDTTSCVPPPVGALRSR
jgi:hypothetical protein